MRSLLTLAIALTLALPASFAAQAGEGEGEVAEIIIKIMTPDGPRWYVLDANLSKIEISAGKIVRFSYTDDTIDAIEVTPDGEPKSNGN